MLPYLLGYMLFVTLCFVLCAACRAAAGGFIKTVIRVLRCVGHTNSKILLDKVRRRSAAAAVLLIALDTLGCWCRT